MWYFLAFNFFFKLLGRGRNCKGLRKMGATETSETKVRHSIEEGDTPFRSDHF